MERLAQVHPNRIINGNDFNALVDVINSLVGIAQTQQELIQALYEQNRLIQNDARRAHTVDRRKANPL